MSDSTIAVPIAPLPRLLVSVRDAAEAEAAIRAGADLIDAKDPENGALGALPPETVRAIVARTAGPRGHERGGRRAEGGGARGRDPRHGRHRRRLGQGRGPSGPSRRPRLPPRGGRGPRRAA